MLKDGGPFHSASQRKENPSVQHVSKIATEWIIVKTRSPWIRTVKWEEGKLSGKSLEATVQSIAQIVGNYHIKEVHWKLITCECDHEITISENDESGFEELKKSFRKEMMKTLELHKKLELNFEIWVEPVYAETAEEQMLPEHLL